jgi:hypothetical protein
MSIRRIAILMVIASVPLLALCTAADAQDCPPGVKAMAPKNGTITDCSYSSLSTILGIQMSGQVPRPDLPEQPYTFSVEVTRVKMASMARRKDMMAQEEMAKLEKAKASMVPQPNPPVSSGPIESKVVPGGKAWYQKITVWSIGESTAPKVHYQCDYYVVDGMSLIRFSATVPDKSEGDAWLAHVRARLQDVQ